MLKAANKIAGIIIKKKNLKIKRIKNKGNMSIFKNPLIIHPQQSPQVSSQAQSQRQSQQEQHSSTPKI